MNRFLLAGTIPFLMLFACGCGTTVGGDDGTDDDSLGIFAERLGDPLPFATPEQLATFERGKAVLLKRFDLSEGLGPQFNVTSCGACHERPAVGGSAGRYRNFFLIGQQVGPDMFFPLGAAGVLRTFAFGEDELAHPKLPNATSVMVQRNPIPMFGVGLLAEIEDSEILTRADEDDADGDGISGRPNFDRGFVGRFGRKSQTVSIEGFIRGPVFNHMGVTSNPLSPERQAQLPVPSAATEAVLAEQAKGSVNFQVAAPAEPNADDDGLSDPEMSEQDLFDVVSFSMLLAPAKPDRPTAETTRGRAAFTDIGCTSCHVPEIRSPRGMLPIFSDLLLHDMGEDLADKFVQGVATGSEFRTQPLWGVSSVGPYLHDGRADTLEEAILAHGGEAQASRDRFAALSATARGEIVAFLHSLGGASQTSPGLLEPDAPVPDVDDYGGPRRDLTTSEMQRFKRGRDLYDRDFGVGSGLGPRFNGDSCRACHIDPIIGGSGPRDVNVMRHGIMSADGHFTAPAIGTILPKQSNVSVSRAEPQEGVNVFEHRQTPHNFGLGLIDAISEATIRSHADPRDEDGDGISGRVSTTADGRVGRLGWKAQVPSVAEFVRDGFGSELGITVHAQPGLTFGKTEDDDEVSDPELTVAQAEDLAFFLSMLAPPPRQASADDEQAIIGETVFLDIGCTKCHIPTLTSSEGPVPLFSDLLLHEILPAGAPGIEDGTAEMREFRTAPLWGLSQTAPYFHSGEADTIDEAIRLHDGEGSAARQAYEVLSNADRAALLAFLNSL